MEIKFEDCKMGNFCRILSYISPPPPWYLVTNPPPNEEKLKNEAYTSFLSLLQNGRNC